MSILLVIVHVIVCLALILIVLLQTGKGADMGAAFGGGASQTLFGTTGASTFLSKATTAAAVIFMLTSLTLAYMSGTRKGGQLVTETPPAAEKTTTESAPVALPGGTNEPLPATGPQKSDQPAAQPAAPAAQGSKQPESQQK